MPQYDDTNRGALFKNNDKASDNHPDYSGKINVDGKDYWVSAWIKEAKNGGKFMSLSVKAKDGAKPTTKTKPKQDDNEDIPF